MRSSRKLLKKSQRELEVPMPALQDRRRTYREYKETRRTSGTRKTKYACIVQADECTRKRLEGTLQKDHENHIAGKGTNSLIHYNLVHRFILMPEAMKIPEAKAAVDKEWGKLQKIPAWQQTKVRNKKDVIDEARKEGKTVHFASLVDICHLNNSELEPKHQKYKRSSRAPR